MLGIILANLSKQIFEIILNLKLVIAIGLNLSIESAFGTFGTRTGVLEFLFGINHHEKKSCLTTLIKSLLIIVAHL